MQKEKEVVKFWLSKIKGVRKMVRKDLTSTISKIKYEIEEKNAELEKTKDKYREELIDEAIHQILSSIKISQPVIHTG